MVYGEVLAGAARNISTGYIYLGSDPRKKSRNMDKMTLELEICGRACLAEAKLCGAGQM